jgi:predicted enzyme related to lactoylglutathione lyase
MPNVVHFEICVDDLQAAVQFYSAVFGWRIEKSEDGEYWSITTGDEIDPGITGGLVGRIDELNPTINTIEVPSLNEFAKRITLAGGQVVTPRIAIAGLGYMQYCKDLEGNAFGIMEYDETVK